MPDSVPIHSPRFLSEADLLKQCREDHYRGSGPGGQKRNKTSNAVRLVHEPTGVVVTATETRSLAENRHHAIHRLRNRLAATVREPIDLATFSPPDWFLEIRHDSRIEVSSHHPMHAPAAGLALDLLAALSGNPAAVATNLGVSTTAVLKLLESDDVFWTEANRIRAAAGEKALTRRR